MAKIDFEKVRIVGLRSHYKVLMQELHRWGVLEVINNFEYQKEAEGKGEEHFGVFDLERLSFSIRFLEPYRKVESKVDSVFSGGKLVLTEGEAKERLKSFAPGSEKIVQECEKMEEVRVRLKNELGKMEGKRKVLAPFEKLDIPLGKNRVTEQTVSWIGKIVLRSKEEYVQQLSELSNLVDVCVLDQDKSFAYFRITALIPFRSVIEEINAAEGFEEVDLSVDEEEYKEKTVREILREMKEKEKEYTKELAHIEKESSGLAKHYDDLCILYDYNAWRKTKNDLQYKIYRSANTFAFEAWVPKTHFLTLEKWIQDIFVDEVSLETLPITEEDVVPSYVENRYLTRPFELVTGMYGMPSKEDIDPTPYLAPFFFVFFGLCLSDVGYGSILTLLCGVALLFGKLGDATRNSIRAMLYCGLSTIVGGILLGGWFGMSVDQAPSFLVNLETQLFHGQILNPMEGNGPLTFLFIALGLGITQILVGILLDFVRRLKHGDVTGAICDPLAWFFFLLCLVGFAVADYIGLPKEIMKNLAILGAVVLVITQGRSQKNWFLKPIFGILGLYNITGYVSDLLSYSRIMALGLATGVIGMAMNLTAGVLGGLMPHPALGFVVAVLILVAGHGLNFSLSLLGAFVHSGRLQFIEFFGKFYEGSGRKFEPFVRQKKYLFFK